MQWHRHPGEFAFLTIDCGDAWTAYARLHRNMKASSRGNCAGIGGLATGEIIESECDLSQPTDPLSAPPVPGVLGEQAQKRCWRRT
jgi:hypothetical protein